MKSVSEIWAFAQLIGQAFDDSFLYVSILELDQESCIREEQQGWVTKKRASSLSGYIHSQKIATVLRVGNKKELVCGENGGIRKGDLIISCNTLFSEGLNYVLERSLLWYAEEDLLLHHHGINHPTIESMEQSIEDDERAFGTKGICPSSLETSCFVPEPKGRFFKEHYFDPKGKTQDLHLAFVTNFPKDFAEAICSTTKAKELKIDFSTGKNDHGEEMAWVFIPSIYTKLHLFFTIDPVWRDPDLL